MAFPEMVGLFYLSENWLTLRERYSLDLKLHYPDCEVKESSMSLSIQAVTTRWHHDSGNKVQVNPKTKGILAVLESLWQTQNTGWVCKPFSEPGSSFPQRQVEVWAEWAQLQVTVRFTVGGGNHLNVWLATRLNLAVATLGGPVCIWNKSQTEVQGIWPCLSQNQKGFAYPCWELF